MLVDNIRPNSREPFWDRAKWSLLWPTVGNPSGRAVTAPVSIRPISLEPASDRAPFAVISGHRSARAAGARAPGHGVVERIQLHSAALVQSAYPYSFPDRPSSRIIALPVVGGTCDGWPSGSRFRQLATAPRASAVLIPNDHSTDTHSPVWRSSSSAPRDSGVGGVWRRRSAAAGSVDAVGHRVG